MSAKVNSGVANTTIRKTNNRKTKNNKNTNNLNRNIRISRTKKKITKNNNSNDCDKFDKDVDKLYLTEKIKILGKNFLARNQSKSQATTYILKDDEPPYGVYFVKKIIFGTDTGKWLGFHAEIFFYKMMHILLENNITPSILTANDNKNCKNKYGFLINETFSTEKFELLDLETLFEKYIKHPNFHLAIINVLFQIIYLLTVFGEIQLSHNDILYRNILIAIRKENNIFLDSFNLEKKNKYTFPKYNTDIRDFIDKKLNYVIYPNKSDIVRDLHLADLGIYAFVFDFDQASKNYYEPKQTRFPGLNVSYKQNETDLPPNGKIFFNNIWNPYLDMFRFISYFTRYIFDYLQDPNNGSNANYDNMQNLLQLLGLVFRIKLDMSLADYFKSKPSAVNGDLSDNNPVLLSLYLWARFLDTSLNCRYTNIPGVDKLSLDDTFPDNLKKIIKDKIFTGNDKAIRYDYTTRNMQIIDGIQIRTESIIQEPEEYLGYATLSRNNKTYIPPANVMLTPMEFLDILANEIDKKQEHLNMDIIPVSTNSYNMSSLFNEPS